MIASSQTASSVIKWDCRESQAFSGGGTTLEDQWFDELSRRLAAPVTRRQAFKTITAAALGGLLIRSQTGEAFGQANDRCAHFCNDQFPAGRARGKCKSDAAQGGGLCYRCGPGSNSCGLSACTGVCCAQGAGCSNGTCACPAGQVVCGAGNAACFGVGTCTDLTTIQNCGDCAIACVGVQPGCCSGSCTDLAGDIRNCGRCGNACTPDQTCTNGKCQFGSPNPECAGASCVSPKLCGPGGSNCFCASLFGGGGVCLKQPPGSTCASLNLQPCTNGTCPPGQHCVVDTCCQTGNPTPLCVVTSLMCPASTTTTAVSS